ncbi:transglutaminase domain-containing protein [Kineosporia sp. J2-2]|uniref:Transglutaminase domain-containing protein n=1 Tax=Kineosporia corallincola TaxID=2835133 RepID=A0ABS5TKF2_9ACTN|nr:transglutaminase-like domain-containing protein [Kineosporia corallincola]MBT0771323.1 transglutaminase domain-containing protein [Kineosporia corallincola]
MKNLATLVTLVAAALGLGLAGLLPAVVCLLVMALVVLVGALVPVRWPQITEVSWRRTGLAAVALGLVVLATTLTGPQNLLTGRLDTPLASAASVLAVPEGVPLGLLAALAAGSLIAVTLELGHHRGVQSGLVLGTAVLGLACVAAPSGQRLLVPIIIGWPAALLALTRLTGEHHPPPEGVRMTLTGPPHAPAESGLAPAVRWRFVPVLLAMTVSCCLLGAAAASGLARIAQNSSFSGGGGAATNSARAWQSKFLGGRMNLNSRGPLSENAVAEVPLDAPAHWRTATLDRYNGVGWGTTGTGGISTSLSQGADGVELRTSGDDSAQTAQTPDDGSTGTGQLGSTRSDRVVIRGSGTAQVISPGRLVSADLPGDYAERTFVSNGDRVLLSAQDNDEYEVTSLVYPDVYREASLGTAADDEVGVSSSTIDERWLQVPVTLPQRVRDLGTQLAAGATSRLAAVRAVEARLGRMMTYTLDAPVPTGGQDAVDFALFDSRQGYCEHFASAEIMLLRSAGIPARMVVGYLADGSDVVDGGRQVIRGAQAHAWVEVWFPDAGWVTSDPTPAGGIGQSFLQSVNSAFNHAMSDLADALVAFATGVVGPVVLVVVLLVLWLFRRVLIAWFVRAPGIMTDDDPPLDPVLRKGLADLDSALLLQGVPRAPNETLVAVRDRVLGDRRYAEPDHSDLLAQKADLERAFDVLTRALYARTPPTPDECAGAAAVFGQEAERRRAQVREGQPVVSLGQSAQLM